MQYNLKSGRGREIQGHKEDGAFFRIKVGPKDIDPEWSIKVGVDPKMPRDQEAEIQMALAVTRKAGPEDIPLMSKMTARESILHIRDPDAEEDKALEEMGKALPPIMAANVAAALKRRGKEELAQEVMMLLRPPRPQGGQGMPQLPPELLRAVITVLAQSGQQKLAMALLAALGVAPPGAGQGMPSPGATPLEAMPIPPEAPEGVTSPGVAAV